MRSYLLYLILISASFSPLRFSAQCTTCFSMEEALKKPEAVLFLSLRDQHLQVVPGEITLFKNLEILDLGNNLITEFPDLPANPKLKKLRVNRNYGLNAAEVLAYCAKQENLEVLDMSRCGIPFLPENISESPSLITLDLSGNKLKSLPGALEKLEKLEVLDLSSNDLLDVIYVGGTLWNLKKLDVSNNDDLRLSSLLMGVSFLPDLEEIILSEGEGSETFPDEIGALQVKKVVIKNTVIKKLNPGFMKNKALKELVFDNCDIFNTTQVTNLLKNMEIEKIDFHNTDCLPQISAVKSVKELILSGSPSIPLDQLVKMKQIETLDLRLQKIDRSKQEQLKSALPNTECLFDQHELDPGMASNTVQSVMKTAPKENVISSSTATTLIYDNTRLDVPQNAFLNGDGSFYNGPVRVQVTEMFDPVSMALSGAPMVYGKGDSTELFGSNGMFEFRAKDAQGKDLQPNPNAIIQVTIRNVQPDNPGQLFAFDSVARQWNVIGTPLRNNTDSLVQVYTDSLNRIDDLSLVTYVDVPGIVRVASMKRKRNEPSLLRFTFRSHGKLKSDKKQRFYSRQYLPNHAQKLVTKYEWKIDSLVSDQTRDMFRDITKQQRKLDLRRRYRFSYDNFPRYVKDLKIEPDFERDHFVMSFRYRDSLVKVPVYLHSGGDTKSLIAQQEKFYGKYLEKQKADGKFARKVQKRREKELKKYADSQRGRMIAGYRSQLIRASSNRTFDYYTKDQLKFGLNNFGLINCDYFDRNVPEDFFVLKGLSDQNGKEVSVPGNVKVLLYSTNTYMERTRLKLPYYKSGETGIFFESGEDELALVNIKRVGRDYHFETKTISIKDMEAAAIKKEIVEFTKR